ncbi:MAG: hypothetical protein KF699_04610 [Phycisphaeraceae bacterium]|nr:hypothetical protein [Phycisphaeraceae bacterium]MBX3405324.1 hypothetical protein [Phycisphaeraceae bacterium]
MRSTKILGTLVAVVAACCTAGASAQITPIAEFSGQYTENLQGYSSIVPVQCFRPASGVFQSTATLCTRTAAGGLTSAIQAFNGGTWAGTSGCAGGMAGYNSTGFCGNSTATSRLTFDFNGPLVGRFGGYFGTNSATTAANGATIEFFDADLVSIGTASITFPACNNASWHWEGWQIDVPVKRVQIYGGAQICLDDLDYDEYVAPVTGACCNGTGCIIVTAANCASNGWTYIGDNMSCEPDPCESTAIGACCFGLSCSFGFTQSDCELSGGVYLGDNITCNDDPCSAPQTGACCVGVACSVATAADCATAGGDYQGDGSACGAAGNPTTCCPANWDGANGVDVPDIFAFLGAWFANDPDAFNFGGTPGVPAIFAYLGAWFAGCP